MRCHMSIQIFPAFPLFYQTEMIFVFNMVKNGVVQAPLFFFGRLDHGAQGLPHLQLLFRKYLHGNSDNDHFGHLSAMPGFLRLFQNFE